jgi:hypothetical protein
MCECIYGATKLEILISSGLVGFSSFFALAWIFLRLAFTSSDTRKTAGYVSYYTFTKSLHFAFISNLSFILIANIYPGGINMPWISCGIFLLITMLRTGIINGLAMLFVLLLTNSKPRWIQRLQEMPMFKK